jgi:hypothetical protein
MRKDYSPSSTLFQQVDKWIKNVYSLRTQMGTTSAELHTGIQLSRQFALSPVHNLQVTPLFVQAFTPLFSTAKIGQSNLLFTHLSPQSTAPINKKKKEILGRNT